MNDQIGSSGSALSSYAKTFQADANGTLTIRIDNSPNPTKFFGVAGVALQKSSAITATVTVDDTLLAIGETANVTIKFSEAVTGFTNADLTVSNGTLSNVATSDGGTTWSAILTPNLDVQSASNVIVVDRSGVSGASGPGSGTSASNNYAIDTLRPLVSISLADASIGAGETTTATFAFSEPITGFGLGDITVDNGTLSNLTSTDGGITFTATFTPTPGITDASNVITVDLAGVVDLAGNVGAGTVVSPNYTIDVVGPRTLSVVVSDTTLLAGETSVVRFAFSEAINGLTLADMTAENGTLTNLTTVDNINFTATLTPAVDLFDVTNIITLDNAGYTDRSGNAGTGSSTSNNYAVQTVRPTSSITVSDSLLSVGETALVTITFSEVVQGFTSSDLTIDNGTVGPVGSADGGVTWTAILTPSPNVKSTTNAVRLNNTRYNNVQGNTGLGTTVSNNFAIDTTRPAAVITVADTNLLIGQTSLVTIVFNDAVTGFTNDDITVENGTLTNVTTADGGVTFTATLTPTDGITDSTNVITINNAGVVDLAGNVGQGTSVSANYAIDTQRPTVVITLADSSLTIGETTLVTFLFSEPVTGFSAADARVEAGLLSAVSTADGGRTFTATFTPTGNLQDLLNVVSVLNAGLQDLSGNLGAGTSTSANYVVDTLRPVVTSITMSDSDLVAGETSQLTIVFSEAVTALTNSDLTVPNGTLSPLSSSDGGITWTALFTPTVNVVDITNVITLDNTGVEDLRGNAGLGAFSTANFIITSNQPTVSIVVADTNLILGETSLVTFTFSTAVTGFDNADITVENGTLSPVSSSNGGLTFTATLTPNAGVTDPTNLIRTDNTGFQDALLVAGVGTAVSNNYAIDQVPPSVNSITLSDLALIAGESAQVTIIFSEPVTSFSNADVAVPNGTLSPLTTQDGGLTWRAVYTPAAGTTDVTNVLAINDAGLTDLAGNAGTGSSSSANFTIDTLRPSATIVVADTQLAIGETSLVTVTFNEPVLGFTKADLTIGSGTISTLSSADGGITWTGTLTPAPGVTVSGNRIVLDNTGYTDASGNAGTGTTNSNAYAVDTIRPTSTISLSDSTLIVGETSLVTIVFSEAVTGFTSADLSVPNGALSAVTSSDGGVTWTATLTPNAGVTDATNAVTLSNASYTDLFGNTGLGSTSSGNYIIDTQRPTSSITLSDTNLRIGETSLVTFVFSEPVTGFSNADLTVQNGTLSLVTTVNQGLTWTATFTPTNNITDTTNVITLNNTLYTDLLGNAGVGTTTSANYIVDTIPPQVSILVADANLLYGETSLVTFSFTESVTGFSNADVTVQNGTLSPVSTANGGSTWTATLTPSVGIQVANNLITVNNLGYTDLAGNTGTGTSISNRYTVNTIADDFGDLPDSYRTTLAVDGARHRAGSLFLGSGLTAEPDGVPSAGANSDVDDGVSFPNALFAGVTGIARVTASQAGQLDAFIDFNNNGVFDASERVTPVGGLAVTAGVNDVRFAIPQTAVDGGRAARFRLSTAGGLASSGAAVDGEVEDYLVTINNPAAGTVQSIPDPDHPGQTMLLVIGTSGDDTISVAASGSGFVVTFKGKASPVLPATSRIVINSRSGNDRVTVASTITLPSVIDGGDGNDSITTGGGSDRVYGGLGSDVISVRGGANLVFGNDGNDRLTGDGVLVGGAGDDTLTTGANRAVMIGGLGKDALNSKTLGNLLIGGTTDFDAHESALQAIFAEWNSGASVQTRISHLTGAVSGGANGSVYLISDAVRPGTVHNDSAVDTLTNKSADDWLLPFAGDKRVKLIGVVNHP